MPQRPPLSSAPCARRLSSHALERTLGQIAEPSIGLRKTISSGDRSLGSPWAGGGRGGDPLRILNGSKWPGQAYSAHAAGSCSIPRSGGGWRTRRSLLSSRMRRSIVAGDRIMGVITQWAVASTRGRRAHLGTFSMAAFTSPRQPSWDDRRRSARTCPRVWDSAAPRPLKTARRRGLTAERSTTAALSSNPFDGVSAAPIRPCRCSFPRNPSPPRQISADHPDECRHAQIIRSVLPKAPFPAASTRRPRYCPSHRGQVDRCGQGFARSSRPEGLTRTIYPQLHLDVVAFRGSIAAVGRSWVSKGAIGGGLCHQYYS